MRSNSNDKKGFLNQNADSRKSFYDLLFVAQGINRVKLGGFVGRVIAKENANQHGKAGGNDNGGQARSGGGF